MYGYTQFLNSFFSFSFFLLLFHDLQSLLTHVSRPTKNTLNKLGVFTVSSFHAFICARSPSLLNNLLAGRGATKRRPPLLSRSNSGSSRRSMQVIYFNALVYHLNECVIFFFLLYQFIQTRCGKFMFVAISYVHFKWLLIIFCFIFYFFVFPPSSSFTLIFKMVFETVESSIRRNKRWMKKKKKKQQLDMFTFFLRR